MVARMRNDSRHVGQAEPEPEGGNVGTHEEGTWEDGGKVGDEVLQGMCIDANYANGGCPFMVNLVDVFVDTRMMSKSVK